MKNPPETSSGIFIAEPIGLLPSWQFGANEVYSKALQLLAISMMEYSYNVWSVYWLR